MKETSYFIKSPFSVIPPPMYWSPNHNPQQRETEDAHQIIFGNLLQCLDGMHLEIQVLCPIPLHDLMCQACKRPLVDAGPTCICSSDIDVSCGELLSPEVPLGPLQWE